jgi:hypothetical protein
VLGAHAGGDRSAEVPGEDRDQRVQRGDAGLLGRTAALLQASAEILVDDGVQNEPRRRLDLPQHALQLTRRADEGVHVLDGEHVLEARRYRLRHGVQRLPVESDTRWTWK